MIFLFGHSSWTEPARTSPRSFYISYAAPQSNYSTSERGKVWKGGLIARECGGSFDKQKAPCSILLQRLFLSFLGDWRQIKDQTLLAECRCTGYVVGPAGISLHGGGCRRLPRVLLAFAPFARLQFRNKLAFGSCCRYFSVLFILDYPRSIRAGPPPPPRPSLLILGKFGAVSTSRWV